MPGDRAEGNEGAVKPILMISLSTGHTLPDAIAAISARTPIGTRLRTDAIQRIPPMLRLRALFSAGLENARVLSRIRRVLLQAVQGQRESDGLTIDRGVFVEELRELIIREGLAAHPDDPEAGTIQDLASYQRLKLIYDTNMGLAQGYTGHQADMEPALLQTFPCYELIRSRIPVEARDWPERWRLAGGAFWGDSGDQPDYPTAPGRMIAVKTDPIWTVLSRFGHPWPPFDFNSGMVLDSLPRRECVALGVIQQGERIASPPQEDFNAGLDVAHGVDDAIAAEVEDYFGSGFVVDEDEGRIRADG